MDAKSPSGFYPERRLADEVPLGTRIRRKILWMRNAKKITASRHCEPPQFDGEAISYFVPYANKA
jgi:hypothetical protein